MNHPIGILAGLAPVKPNRALANALEPGPPPPSAPLSTRWPLASVVPTGLRRSSRPHHLCSVPPLPSSASPLRHHCLSRSCRPGSPPPVDHGSSWRSREPGRSDASSSWATSARSHPPPAQCSGDGEARSSKAALQDEGRATASQQPPPRAHLLVQPLRVKCLPLTSSLILSPIESND